MLDMSQVFNLLMALKDCSAVADKARIASRFLPLKKKKKSFSLGMRLQEFVTSAADLKF